MAQNEFLTSKYIRSPVFRTRISGFQYLSYFSLSCFVCLFVCLLFVCLLLLLCFVGVFLMLQGTAVEL